MWSTVLIKQGYVNQFCHIPTKLASKINVNNGLLCQLNIKTIEYVCYNNILYH